MGKELNSRERSPKNGTSPDKHSLVARRIAERAKLFGVELTPEQIDRCAVILNNKEAIKKTDTI